MNARFFRTIAAVVLVTAAATGAFLLGSPFTLADPGIPEPVLANPIPNPADHTAAQEMDLGQMNENAKLEFPAILIPIAKGELDLGQFDEKAKLEPYPRTFAASTSELDVAQQDEKAKLEPYPATFSPQTTELDLGQIDEKSKLEAYPAERPLTDVELRQYQWIDRNPK